MTRDDEMIDGFRKLEAGFSRIFRKPTPSRASELWAIRKMRPTVGELRALSDRFADAVQLMQISAMNEHLPGIRSAHLSLHDIVRQTEFLNVGIAHAIEAIQQESKS